MSLAASFSVLDRGGRAGCGPHAGGHPARHVAGVRPFLFTRLAPCLQDRAFLSLFVAAYLALAVGNRGVIPVAGPGLLRHHRGHFNRHDPFRSPSIVLCDLSALAASP